MMRKAWRIISFLVAFTVLAGANSFAFSDVNPSTDEGKAISVMQEKGYINGFGDGTFRPGATLTRAEFVTIINKMYGFSVETENIFTDIKKDDWYYSSILSAVQAGYIKGMGDGTFRPNEAVTREQVCVMLNSILKIELLPYGQKPSDAVSEWARESVERMIAFGIFSLEENDRFRATEPIKRGEVCVALEKCVVDAPDEWDSGAFSVESMAREELEKLLARVIESMENKVIPLCEDPVHKEVAEGITDSLKEYLADPDYDYVASTKAIYEIYRTQTPEEATVFKKLLAANLKTDEVMLLYEVFFSEGVENVLG